MAGIQTLALLSRNAVQSAQSGIQMLHLYRHTIFCCGICEIKSSGHECESSETTGRQVICQSRICQYSLLIRSIQHVIDYKSRSLSRIDRIG